MATTVSVTLLSVFLHDAANLAQYLALDNCMELTEDASGPVDVRLYASGRIRRTTMRGVITNVALMFERCTRAQVDQLRDWQDTFLALRDPRGRVLYGSYDSKRINVSEYGPIDAADVTITFAVVTPPDLWPIGATTVEA